ncbi:MAG: glycosyltransferase [Proteobacteria bacterium]|nr:MAG: glycosyltransferase [Pseudomonadota bacterium]
MSEAKNSVTGIGAAVFLGPSPDSDCVTRLEQFNSLCSIRYVGAGGKFDDPRWNVVEADSAAEFLSIVQELASRRVDHLLWASPVLEVSLYAPLVRQQMDADGYRIRHYDPDGVLRWRTALLSTARRWRLDPVTGDPVCDDPSTRIDYLDAIIAVSKCPGEALKLEDAQAIPRLVELARTGSDAAVDFDLGYRFRRLGDAESAGPWFQRRADRPTGDAIERALAMFYESELRRERGAAWWELEPRYHAAFELAPTRAEPLLPIIRHYRKTGSWDKAYALAQVAAEMPFPKDPYPIERRVYHLDIPREMMLCAAHFGFHHECVEYASVAIEKSSLMPETAPEIFELRRASLDELQPSYPIAARIRNRIKVIVPFRNAGRYLQKCIESLRRQDYDNFHVYLIDDASDDGCADRLDLDDRFTLIRNDSRREALYNQHHVLTTNCDADDIAFFLDGDDWLAVDDALSYVNDVFNRTGCWVMYGQCTNPDWSMTYAVPLIPDGDIVASMKRSKLRFPLHPRCHRAGLYHRIADQDPEFSCLRDTDGAFYTLSSDFAHTRTIFHLAGTDRIHYNDHIIYIYNRDNPNLTSKAARQEQLEACHRISEQIRLQSVSTYEPREKFTHLATRRSRMLVCTLEGMDAELIRRWAGAGELPFLQSLLTRGTSVPVDIARGFFSTDSFLTSAATGAIPHRHENLWAERLLPGLYGFNTAQAPQPLAVFPYWDHLARQGLRVAVLNPFALPLTREQNVTQLQNWGIHVPWGDVISHPAELAADVLKRFGDSHVHVGSERTRDLTESDHVALRDRLISRIEAKRAAYGHYLARGDWDVFHVFFDEGHDAGHQMWHVHDRAHRQHPPDWIARHGDPLLAIYKKLDQALKDLWSRAGDVELFVLAGPGMETATSCSDQLPAMLARIENETASPATASPPRDSVAFALPGNKQLGAIRINLVGREPAGRVHNRDEFDAWCNTIEEGLKQFVDAASGQSIVEEVIRVRSAASTLPADSLPDLVVVWRRIPQPSRISSSRYGDIDIVTDPENALSYRTGDHNGNAMLLTNLPLCSENTPESMSLESVAPTICARFGIKFLQADAPAWYFRHHVASSPIEPTTSRLAKQPVT